jgi:hypothetical protein
VGASLCYYIEMHPPWSHSTRTSFSDKAPSQTWLFSVKLPCKGPLWALHQGCFPPNHGCLWTTLGALLTCRRHLKTSSWSFCVRLEIQAVFLTLPQVESCCMHTRAEGSSIYFWRHNICIERGLHIYESSCFHLPSSMALGFSSMGVKMATCLVATNILTATTNTQGTNNSILKY